MSIARGNDDLRPGQGQEVLGDGPKAESPRESQKPRGTRLLGHDPESQARRLAGLQAAREKGAHYKRDFADAGYWDELARAEGVRLPQWHQPPVSARMRHWLQKLGIPMGTYLKYAGERNLSDFAHRNPEWPLRAWVGLLLEAKATGAFEVMGDEESAEAAAALDKLGDG